MPSKQTSGQLRDASAEQDLKRGRKSPVDWVAFFGGKPPAEIITIHDDDSPAPSAKMEQLPGPTNGSSAAQHVDKKRRTNAAAADAAYSATNTPYSYSNGTSTESLQTTTAPTSLGSQISSSSKLEGARAGEKRKRTATRTSDQERKKQDTERAGPQGYLAEYGEYIPPPKQHRKQKEVHVPAIHDVSLIAGRVVVTITNLFS
jgi:dual-specificity kinase